MQASCEQDEDMLKLKNVLGLCASVIGLLMCLVYYNTVKLMQSTNQINEKIFDSELITLGDYSVSGKISQEQWEKFLT